MKKRIIDNRKKEKYMIDDEYLNSMARLCGWQATIVYNSLCRHASKSQECFPSIKLMSEQHSVSRDTILKGLKILNSRNVIKIEKTRSNTGKWLNNTYILLDKSEWNYDQVDETDTVTESTSAVYQVDETDTDRVDVVDTKETHKQGNTYKETHTSELSSQDRINEVFDVFYNTINPTLNYQNTTSRKATEWMINKWGIDAVVAMAKYACSIYGQPYAPTVTTPYQLKEKISAIKAFKQKHENKNKITII